MGTVSVFGSEEGGWIKMKGKQCELLFSLLCRVGKKVKSGGVGGDVGIGLSPSSHCPNLIISSGSNLL